ncbi:MAG: hypothetical protein HRT72_08630, partial [Flavobacteriales bacterium]|nr:hypothetical protein [Flavobacteriales bacterium]
MEKIKIPLKAKLFYLINSRYSIIAIAMLGISFLLFTEIYSNSDWLSHQIKSDSPTTTGRVINCDVWNDEYYQINYSYQTPEEEETYYWRSYSQTPASIGQEIKVTYLKAEPTVSM